MLWSVSNRSTRTGRYRWGGMERIVASNHGALEQVLGEFEVQAVGGLGCGRSKVNRTEWGRWPRRTRSTTRAPSGRRARILPGLDCKHDVVGGERLPVVPSTSVRRETSADCRSSETWMLRARSGVDLRFLSSVRPSKTSSCIRASPMVVVKSGSMIAGARSSMYRRTAAAAVAAERPRIPTMARERRMAILYDRRRGRIHIGGRNTTIRGFDGQGSGMPGNGVLASAG